MGYDVIVIGVGAMGAATLEQLSRRGAKVLGIEQSLVPNADGSSGGETRLIRKAYFEHSDYVPLLERAYQNWRDIEERSGTRLLFPTGALYLGPPLGELIAGSLSAARIHDIALEELSRAELETRYPQFCVPPDYAAAYEPDAGFVMSGRSIEAFAALACEQGADLLTQTRVEGWRADASGVEVVTSAGLHRGDKLVIAGGSWNHRLLSIDGLALTVTRQPLFWVSPKRAEQFELGRFPCWALERDECEGVFYGFPGAVPGVEQAGVKFAHHHPGQPCLPDEARADAKTVEYKVLRDSVAPFIPALDGPICGAVTCMYTMSKDQHFIVDQHPEHANVSLAAGFSGHGFKFAAVIGELLADYALQGSTALECEFLRIGRRDLFEASGISR
ncbi:MAG: N-methyl-L-tryptophan oxidase [Pseudomonadales bacterium]